MAKPEPKTKPSGADVDVYLGGIPDELRRADCVTLVRLMRQATKSPPRMWGSAIVGFGSRHYRYESGHEGDTCVLGFANRKQALTLYLGGLDTHRALLDRLGKFKTGKGCVYIKRLEDVDLAVLKALLAEAARRAAAG
jgi:uncharacterized protein DUF1801